MDSKGGDTPIVGADDEGNLLSVVSNVHSSMIYFVGNKRGSGESF